MTEPHPVDCSWPLTVARLNHPPRGTRMALPHEERLLRIQEKRSLPASRKIGSVRPYETRINQFPLVADIR